MDVDLLADGDVADAIDAEMRRLGYGRLHRSVDSATFVRGDERVDFLFAHQTQPLAFLPATPRSVESHQPSTAVTDPFRALDDLMAVVEALCPRWPARPALTQTQGWRL